ncbi:unnamed protein product [Prunus armeniaca]
MCIDEMANEDLVFHGMQYYQVTLKREIMGLRRFLSLLRWWEKGWGYAPNGLCHDALKTFLVATMESKPNNYTFGSVLSAIGDAQDISLKYGQ